MKPILQGTLHGSSYSAQIQLRTQKPKFNVLDPKGILEMLLVFLEDRGSTKLFSPSFDDSQDDRDRIMPHLGKWKGHSITKRSGVYVATLAEADTFSKLEIDKDGQLIQDVASTSGGRDVTTNVHWMGKMSKNLVIFDGGFQLTLLPGGIYMEGLAVSSTYFLETKV